MPRFYWSGPSPEDPDEMWFFETVIDNGQHIAIRQVTIERDGTRHAYSVDHLEDEWGFLTDRAVEPESSDGLEPTTSAKLDAA